MSSLGLNTLILIVTALVSISAFNDQNLKYRLTLSPYAVKHSNRWWLLFTHGFVHGDSMHLLFNMIALYSFGNLIEMVFVYEFGKIAGMLMYAGLYFGGLLFATLPAMLKHGDDFNYLSLGASGAVSAVLMTSILIFPLENISLFFSINMPAWLFGILYIGFELYANKNSRGNIAHDAHLAGLLFGLIFVSVTMPQVLSNFLIQMGLS